MKTENGLPNAEGNSLNIEAPRSPSPRLARWITLCDELSLALLESAREALRQSTPPLERVDTLKEIVTVGHRLFALERALAVTPRLAGEQGLACDAAALAQRFEEFLRMSQEFPEPPTSAETKAVTETNGLDLFPADTPIMSVHEP